MSLFLIFFKKVNLRFAIGKPVFALFLVGVLNPLNYHRFLIFPILVW